MLRLRLPTLLALAPLAVLWGCGDRDGTFRTDRPIVRFELDEYRIGPQDVTIRPGRVKIQARNVGTQPHNLAVVVPREGVDGEIRELGRTETIREGADGEPIKLDLSPGDYRLVCTIANHDDLGQFGELHVEGS